MSTPSLSIRKGTSQARDAAAAVRELHAALDQPHIKLAVFYCSPELDRAALEIELARCFKDIHLIGCTTAGEITPLGYLSGALTGVSIAADSMDAVTEVLELVPFEISDGQAATSHLMQRLASRHDAAATAENTFAFLLIDGLAMQEEMVVSCVHQALGGIELIGGSAADETTFGSTWLYYQGKFRQNIALLTLVRSELPFLTFRTQHFVKTDQRMVVTKADPASRTVQEINGLPAGMEYARQVGLAVTELTPLIFATYPVVVRVGGEYFVRSIATVNPDNSLNFFCAIDEGIVLTIGKAVSMVDNLRQAFADVEAKLGKPQLVLGCDCILRRLETERANIKDEIGRILADNNVIGFATYGEQFNSMHVNQTFTAIAIGGAQG